MTNLLSQFFCELKPLESQLFLRGRREIRAREQALPIANALLPCLAPKPIMPSCHSYEKSRFLASLGMTSGAVFQPPLLVQGKNCTAIPAASFENNNGDNPKATALEIVNSVKLKKWLKRKLSAITTRSQNQRS
jgi:hypothetical protein